jgi:hypothetical protein
MDESVHATLLRKVAFHLILGRSEFYDSLFLRCHHTVLQSVPYVVTSL